MSFLTTMQLYWLNFLTTAYLAVGDKTKQYAINIITGIGTIIAGAGGTWLIVVGIKDIVSALNGDSKDWKKVIISVIVITIGGAILAMSVTNFINLGKNIGSDFNITG